MHSSFLTRKGQGSVATAEPNLSEIYLGYRAAVTQSAFGLQNRRRVFVATNYDASLSCSALIDKELSG